MGGFSLLDALFSFIHDVGPAMFAICATAATFVVACVSYLCFLFLVHCAKFIELLLVTLGFLNGGEKVSSMVKRFEFKQYSCAGDVQNTFIVEIYRTADKRFYPRVFRYKRVGGWSVKGLPSGSPDHTLVCDDTDDWYLLKGGSINRVIEKVACSIEHAYSNPVGPKLKGHGLNVY